MVCVLSFHTHLFFYRGHIGEDRRDGQTLGQASPAVRVQVLLRPWRLGLPVLICKWPWRVTDPVLIPFLRSRMKRRVHLEAVYPWIQSTFSISLLRTESASLRFGLTYFYFSFYLMYESVLSACVSMHCVGILPCQNPWDWGFRQLWATMEMLGFKPRSSGREPSALNCRDS